MSWKTQRKHVEKSARLKTRSRRTNLDNSIGPVGTFLLKTIMKHSLPRAQNSSRYTTTRLISKATIQLAVKKSMWRLFWHLKINKIQTNTQHTVKVCPFGRTTSQTKQNRNSPLKKILITPNKSSSEKIIWKVPSKSIQRFA